MGKVGEVKMIREYIIKISDEIMEEEIADRPQELVRCKDCKYRSYYCTEATDGTTLYVCYHPCANDVPRPGDWFCADGVKRDE